MTVAPGLERFAEAARSAGAIVSVLAPGDDLQHAIGGVLLQEQAARVAISPAAAAEPWRADIAVAATGAAQENDSPFDADAGITTADFALADTGTLVVLASPGQHRLDSLAPAVHIVLVRAADLVANLEDLFARLVTANAFDASSAITFIRGPSRTADIELTLSIGVHGPKKVHVIMST
jgi:L-lactate dehydrogenase complex protein LldG